MGPPRRDAPLPQLVLLVHEAWAAARWTGGRTGAVAGRSKSEHAELRRYLAGRRGRRRWNTLVGALTNKLARAVRTVLVQARGVEFDAAHIASGGVGISGPPCAPVTTPTVRAHGHAGERGAEGGHGNPVVTGAKNGVRASGGKGFPKHFRSAAFVTRC